MYILINIIYLEKSIKNKTEHMFHKNNFSFFMKDVFCFFFFFQSNFLNKLFKSSSALQVGSVENG